MQLISIGTSWNYSRCSTAGAGDRPATIAFMMKTSLRTHEQVDKHGDFRYETDQPEPGKPGIKNVVKTAHVYLSIFLLFLNYFLAQYDKFILSYFRTQVTASLNLTETQYGLISGYATGIVYALLALVVAFVADYTAARVWTLSIAAAWWSLCVVFQGLVNNFGQLYCARLGMGIGQAAVEALSISLISDLVAWRNVFLGNSVLYVGVYVGEAVNGQIATAFNNNGTSWQVAMRAIGITGIVIAVLLRIVLREPSRRRSLVQDREGVVNATGEDMFPGIDAFPHNKQRSIEGSESRPEGNSAIHSAYALLLVARSLGCDATARG